MREDSKEELILESDNSVKEGMTFNQFLKNPNVGVSAYMLSSVKESLTNKYKNMIAKHGKFKYNLARGENNSYIIHVVIPSESLDRLSYDAVIEFTKITETEPKNLGGYAIRVYCNSPSFTFTYAYAYNEEDMYIEWLKDKTEKSFLNDAPTNKNPFLVLGYEKFVFMACMFIQENSLLGLIDYPNAKYIKKTELYKVIVDTETKRKEAQLRKASRSKEKKHLDKITKTRIANKVTSNTIPKTTNRVSKVSKIGGVNKVKGSKISKIKHIGRK